LVFILKTNNEYLHELLIVLCKRGCNRITIVIYSASKSTSMFFIVTLYCWLIFIYCCKLHKWTSEFLGRSRKCFITWRRI